MNKLFDDLSERYTQYDCGKDGMSFPYGLPEPNTKVMVKTVWSGGEWKETWFMEKYKWDHQYRWFGVYGTPCIEEGSMPIVLEWEYIDKES